MLDTFKHKGMRKQLIETLSKKGIKSNLVLEAFNAVPRHFFLDQAFTEQAYTNMPFQIGANQTISHPYTVAFQSELLAIRKGDKILEIGTGSGFQTAILCELGAKVYSIERQKELFFKTKYLLAKLNYIPKLKYGDGYEGWSSFAPFNSIIVTCGAPFIPEKLVEQLKLGGRLVIPVGDGQEQEMLVIEKDNSGKTHLSKKGVFSFVPMLKDRNK